MANSYDQVYQLIIDDTKRPDKSAEIIRRIQRAVTKYHRKDFWKKDLVIQIYAFKDSAQLQSIDTTLLPRFRALSFMRKFDPSSSTPTSGGELKEVGPNGLIDGYGYDKTNVFYRAGGRIQLNSSTPIHGVVIGYFVDPQIEPAATMNSWIMFEYPSLIAAEVKEKVFADIGKTDEATRSRLEINEELSNLYTNNLTVAVV